MHVVEVLKNNSKTKLERIEKGYLVNPIEGLEGDRLVSLKYISSMLDLSAREVRRNIPDWTGFPNALKMGHRTVRYSHQGFHRWLEQFKTQNN